MKGILEKIVEDTALDLLPVQWQEFDLIKFSHSKSLFPFQVTALENALKALWLFYNKLEGDKNRLFDYYNSNGLTGNYDYDLTKKEGKKTAKYFTEYENDFPAENSKISFTHFINRMNFWMATGSGKTLIIVKLIEILGRLIREKEIPQKDILFLAHRDDLIEQFKKHIDEYNSLNYSTRINLKNLKEFDQAKRELSLFTGNEITVFYYKSDLFTDETKDKQINFRNYDNNGDWYILLDEAHKGDREESIRQTIFSILTRNGFLFNFSATFTDPKDYAATVYNFNLAKYVEEGFGKHIFISKSGITAFRDKDDFTETEKQKIVLKTLLLFTIINQHLKKIREADKQFYHLPMMITLVNSVNTEEADLLLFFKEIEKIAAGEVDGRIFEEAKEELCSEFNGNFSFEYESESKVVLQREIIEAVSLTDIYKEVFNSNSPGKIEVKIVPGNKSELIFKLTSAPVPFALIKIGDISNWLKEKLNNYEINESYDNESFFKKINDDDSDIKLLMGSRTFYEGWDSNRPNVILFINIGVGTDARKFVLQSIGRGVRIEPVKNKRKRVKNLLNAQQFNLDEYNNIKDLITPIESLFIYGTNANNLKEIIKTLKDEEDEIEIGDLFEVNKEIEGKTLLIPKYKKTEKLYAEENEISKYQIPENDYKLLKEYLNYISDKVALTKYDYEVKGLELLYESVESNHKFLNIKYDNDIIIQPEIHISRLSKYFLLKARELEIFKLLENEIVHFKKIRINSGEHLYELRKKIESVKNYKDKDRVLEQLKLEYENHKDLDKYTKAVQSIENEYKSKDELSINGKRIKIKYAHHHYYIPVLISEDEKLNYLKHIIKVPSEVKFLEELEKYLEKDDNIFNEYDWWMFSKIDETLDEIYIPYYNPKLNSIAKYKPGFIFWFQKGDEYKIIFVDPKGSAFSSYQHKVDGFKKVFENKIIPHNELRVEVKLKLFSRDASGISEGYRKYWFDNISSILS